MKLDDLLGGRFAGQETGTAFEGPLGDERVAMDLDGAATAVRRLERVLAEAAAGNEGFRVGILSNHRVETYLAVLAAVAAGVPFVPLNPKFPVARLTQICELGGVDLILVDTDSDPALAPLRDAGLDLPSVDVTEVVAGAGPADEPAEVAAWRSEVGGRPMDPDAVAYVLFTSGSTGTPKGVPISYRNLTSYVTQVCGLLEIPLGRRFTQLFDLSFDLSMHDIFVCTHRHGTLVAPTRIDLMMPSGYVSREAIDVWFSVPILGAQLTRSAPKAEFPGLELVLFCGEALPMETVIACRPWLRPEGRIWNLYGPTEATIAFTAADVTTSPRTDGNASIGHPFGANEIALLHDGEVDRTPATGQSGELLLGGPQVFGGYSTDAPSPFVEGTRWYRSGDLVHFDEHGVYFRGRLDSQVKFRGYRIELGEIEAAVRRSYGLKTVAVVMQGERAQARLLMFHLAAESAGPLDPGALAGTLPDYMIPSEFVALDAMPTNQNNKIDRRALAAWTPPAEPSGTAPS